MSDQNLSGAGPMSMVIPAFGSMPEAVLSLEKTRVADSRLLEARTVNPITYRDLEYTFSESFGELKRHLAMLVVHLAKADKELALRKAEVLLDKYPDFLAERSTQAKEKGVKFQDSADHREAFLIRDPAYQEALDHQAKLKAIEAYLDGRVRVMEKVSVYMRKHMDLLMRSGLASGALGVTNKGGV